MGQEYYANTRKIDVENGLSHYKVLSFYPEDNGMWIGTEDGLNFYDGYDWKYWTKDNNELSNKAVNFIYEDQEGRLWLFDTEKVNRPKDVLGIDILSASRDSIHSFEKTLGSKAPFELADIQHFFVDAEKAFYFFARDQFWQFTKHDTFRKIDLPEGFHPNRIFPDGTILGRLNKRLAMITKDRGLVYCSDAILSEEYFYTIGSREKFWLCQDYRACWVFEQKEDKTYTSKLFFTQKEWETILLLKYDEKHKRIWVTADNKLYAIDHQGQLLYQMEGISPRVADIDAQGNFWAGRQGAVIIQLQKKKFDRYLYCDEEETPIKNSYKCRGIIERAGNLLVNTYKGIQIVDPQKGTRQKHPLGEIPNFCFLEDHNGHIWAGRHGLIQLDETGTEILQEYPSNTIGSSIWAMFEDLEHRIWIGHEGISYFENGVIHKFEQYNDFEKLAEARVLFFYKDKNGVIWIGANNGLYQLDPQKGIVAAYGKFQKGNYYLPSSKFQHMYQDRDGSYWLATEDAGLIRWNKTNGAIQQFDKSHGFLSSNIYSVYEDDYGYLWMSSFKGLIRFNKSSETAITFTKEDGICDNEFNRISHFQTENGRLYFGGQNGVTAFHPKDFIDDQNPEYAFDLNVKYTSVITRKVKQDTISDQSQINLQHLSPATAAINLQLECSDIFWTDKVKIHYILQKLDRSQNLVIASKENVISGNHLELFGLNPGAYNLKIQAIHLNGKQLGKTLNIPISIRIPFFHTLSFWIGISIILFLGTWGFIKLRTVQFRKRQAQLQVMVEERTQEILNNQKTIKNQAEQIEEMKDQLQRRDGLWLEQFQSIIKERLADPDLYLPDIIDEMDISRTVFYQKVKSLTHMTPNQYIQELRLVKAKDILDEGSVKTVKEVAQAIGMRRPAYFSKLFKDRFGILPSAYFRSSSN